MPDSPEMVPVRLSRRYFSNPWIYPLLACFLLVTLLSLRKIGTDDLGFHLKAGQWIVQHLAFPQKDSFTYTQTNRDYLDSNGLYQVLLYGLSSAFGYGSLTLLNTLVILIVFSLLWIRMAPAQAPPWASSLFLLAAILGMERRFIVRPEVFSWLYLELTLWVLGQRFSRARNLLFLLPIIQWFWVNTEGLFMLGWAAMGAYGLSEWFHRKRLDGPLAYCSLASVALGLLNPYGLNGLLFPFRLWTRLQDSSPYKQTIAEFLSPWHALWVQDLGFDLHLNLFLFFAAAIAGSILLVLTYRQRKLHEVLLFLAFLFLALKAVRNIPLFLLVLLPILSACLVSLNPGTRWARDSKFPAALILSLFTLLWCLRVLTNAYYITDRRNDRFGLGIDAQVLPVKAAQFLAQNGLDGRMLNDLETGGWLDWQAPQPTFMDGRLEVPEDSFYQQVMDSFSSGGLIPLLAAADARIVVLEYNSSAPWVDQLDRFSNWRLVYLDGCAAIYARWDYAPQIPLLSLSSLLKTRGIADSPGGAAQFQGLKPSKLGTWARGFYLPQTYDMGDFSMGLFALRSGFYGPARDFLTEGFRGTNGDYPEVFSNLALVNFRLQDTEPGRLCLNYALQLDPSNRAALEILKNFSQ